MAVNIFKECINPISGESFKVLSFTEDALTMEWKVNPDGYVPFEHVHLNQDELFHVTNGEIRINMDGSDFIAGPGETLVVPKGIKHIAYNNRNEVLHCTVEYKPGLDHDKFMQCFMGLTDDRLIDKKGGISIPRMGYFLTRMKARCMARPTAIPAPVFNLALKVFYIRGVLSGWGILYDKYIGD